MSCERDDDDRGIDFDEDSEFCGNKNPNRFGIRGKQIVLYVQFTNEIGVQANTDTTPQVAIYDSYGTLQQMSTNLGVGLANCPGLYSFNYSIPLNGSDGYWSDVWTATIGGDTVTAAFQFLVSSSGAIASSSKPIYEPGGVPGIGTGVGEVLDFTKAPFKFSKEEAAGVNILLQLIKPRLKNDGVRKVPDGMGSFITVPCTIFTDSELIAFLVNSLSEFNQIPHFSFFRFCDPQIFTIFSDVIVQGAVILALAAQSLIEKGREFVITDNGVTYQPPQIAELLNTQYSTQLADYKEKVKFIKCNLKPRPLGLGTFRTTSISPAYLRLRHLRERQII